MFGSIDIKQVFKSLSVGIVFGLFIQLLGLVICFCLDVSLGSLSHTFYWLGLLLGTFFVNSKSINSRSSVVLSIIINVSVTLLLVLMAKQFYSLNYDGMESHQETIVCLTSGWNPIKDSGFAEAEKFKETYPLLVDSKYAPGGTSLRVGYLLSAVIVKATGSMESGKAINLIYSWMLFVISMWVFLDVFKRKLPSVFLSLLVVLNPISIVQWFSYYADGQLAVVFSALILLIVSSWRSVDVYKTILFCMLALVLAASKLVGIGLVGLIVGVIFLRILYLNRRNTKQLSKIVAGFTLFVGLAIMVGHLSGYYDLKKNDFPFHPARISGILDPEKLDYWIGAEIPGSSKAYPMKGMNRFEQFVASNFSSSNISREKLLWKLPFTVQAEELNTFRGIHTDLRLGAFGPLYGGLLLLALFCFFAYLINVNPRQWDRSMLGILLVLLLPCFFLPTWWARWIPQMWLLPLVLLILGAHASAPNVENRKNARMIDLSASGSTVRFMSKVGLGLMFINSFIVLICNLSGHYREKIQVEGELDEVESWNSPVVMFSHEFLSNRLWLADRGIAFEIVKKPFEDADKIFTRSGTRLKKIDKDLMDYGSDK